MSKVKDIAPDTSLNGKAPELLPLKFVTSTELEEMDVPEREWIIDKVLPVGLVSCIVAESGAGKTWLALDMLRSIVSGDEWANKYPCKRMTCGMVDLEGDYRTLKDRWQKMNAGMGKLDRDHAPIYFLSDIGRIDVLSDNTIMPRLQAAIQHNDIGLLFVDTLIRTHSINENDAAMSDVIERFERVARETNCTLVLIHHAGKGQTGRPISGRGSSAIKAACQHEIAISKETDTSRKVSLTKGKHAPEVDRLATLVITNLDRGGISLDYPDDPIKQDPGRPSQKEAREKAIIGLLTDAPMSYTALVKGVMGKAKCSKTSAERTFREMEENKQIIQLADKRYDLPDSEPPKLFGG